MLDASQEADDQLDELDALFRARLDLYCAGLVRIKGKDGQHTYLELNKAQRYADDMMNAQLERTGKVRALILKARQLGMSTYVAARFYRKTTMNAGQRTYILTHEDKSTQSLFDMAKRVHDNMVPEYRPAATSNNANELDFGGIDSGYRVGTAKNVGGLGRGMTIQNFHGSEVAFWPHAEQHFAGVMEAIPNMPHTEIILESTANGVGGAFYDQWQLAERGLSEFMPIFIPWYWDDGYEMEVPPDFEPSYEEAEYSELYGLSMEQIVWMHFKNIQLGADPGKIHWQFRQEYPASPQEAFQTSGQDTLISPETVMRARKFEAPEQDHAAKVLGVDVARAGGDFTRFIDRQGRRAGKIMNEVINSDDLMEIAGRVARAIDEHDFQMTFLDVTGLGAGVYDRLVEMGYGYRVRAVNFAQKPHDPERFRNKRAEMWWEMKEWLKDPGGADIPDDDAIHRHLCAPGYKWDSNNRMVLEPKADIKDRLGFSPDAGDALAMTFAERVVKAETKAIGGGVNWTPPDWLAS